MDKSNIGSLFDRIAGSYDGLNHFLSLGIDRVWRRKAVCGMKVSGAQVLDVAVGTADLTLELFRRSKAASVTGLDLSEKMMEIGKKKVDAASLTDKTSFVCGSALDMPFPDSRFDAVTCAYGARNFSDLDKGLNEMFRVLKDGGELMILEFSYPSNAIIRTLYDFYFSNILPFVGRLVSRDKSAYTYLNRSVKAFIWGEEFCRHLETAGFSCISFKSLTFGITTIYRAFKPVAQINQ